MSTQNTIIVAAVLGTVMMATATGQAQEVRRPKLVVQIVVDQMRADYVERYGHQWTQGFRRLMTGGARFPRAAFPYANTVTCAGHATIATGVFPRTHGITGNSWFDRATWKTVRCADDPGAVSISYGAPVAGGFGPGRLLVSTLADELRAQSPGPVRVVSLSMKERTAIMLAGRHADAATWFAAAVNAPVTTSRYTEVPVPFVAAFVKANPVASELATPWTRALPVDRYLFDDDGVGEKPPPFRTRTFPHALTGTAPGDDGTTAWDASPRSDDYLGRLAVAAVDALRLGQGSATDYLAISFSALDLVGHDFGPNSHEVQDVLIRLDDTVGRLLTHLDRQVGRGAYVVALTGDHGVAAIPERSVTAGLDAGRLRTTSIQTAVREALQRALGAGDHRFRQQSHEIYLDAVTGEALRANPQAVETLLDALRAVPGVAAAYYSGHLASLASAGDREARAALLSWAPGRSGDVIVYPRPNWFFVYDDGSSQPGDGTSHGTPYAYDQRVPLWMYGTGIKPGEYLRPVSPTDLAPTLAFLCGVTLPRPDGDVLIEALEPRPLAVVR